MNTYPICRLRAVSLFFFRFSESSARARERRSREMCETRGADREEKESLSFSCLSRLAPSVTRVAICVSPVLVDGLQKKEILLVVYPITCDLHSRDRREAASIRYRNLAEITFLCVNRCHMRYGILDPL